MKNKLFIVVNVDWFFLSHRLPIALKAMEVGFDITILAKDTGKKEEIEKYGLHFIDIPFDRSGSNPFHELMCINKLYRIYKTERPDVIHHVTLKASLLGSLAAKLAKNKNVVNAISGFGYNFTDGRKGLKQTILRKMISLAFKSNHFQYIFQNPDDEKAFINLKLAQKKNIHIIKGSGVDLSTYAYCEPMPKEKLQFVLVARMLYDKGILEFIESAKLLKEQLADKVEFRLIGDCDTDNLAGIDEQTLKRLLDPPYITWLGFCSDVYSVYKNSDVVVLPSYREGLPKSLIEACAVGRPIITTDAIGCRECVDDAYNGFTVPIKDTNVLAEKMLLLANDASLRNDLGRKSRIKAEREFSLENVINLHLHIYEKILYK